MRKFVFTVALAVNAVSLALAADPLPRAKPESVGMNTARLGRIGAALQTDVDKGWEQGGRALSALVDRVVRDDFKRLRISATKIPVTVYAPQEWPGQPFDADRTTILWRLDTVGKQMWLTGTSL